MWPPIRFTIDFTPGKPEFPPGPGHFSANSWLKDVGQRVSIHSCSGILDNGFAEPVSRGAQILLPLRLKHITDFYLNG